MASTWRFCVASISGVLPSCQPHRKRSVGICMYTWYRPIIHFAVTGIHIYNYYFSFTVMRIYNNQMEFLFFFLKVSLTTYVS